MISTGETPLFAYLKDEECASINGGGLSALIAPGIWQDIPVPGSIPYDKFNEISSDLKTGGQNSYGNSDVPKKQIPTRADDSLSEWILFYNN